MNKGSNYPILSSTCFAGLQVHTYVEKNHANIKVLFPPQETEASFPLTLYILLHLLLVSHNTFRCNNSSTNNSSNSQSPNAVIESLENISRVSCT